MIDKPNLNDEHLSEDTKKLVELFQAKQSVYQSQLNIFFDRHNDLLQSLDNSREDMNAALDDARRGLRADAERAPYTKVKKIQFNGFKIQKKWTSWYIVEMFVSLVKNNGLYDAAIAAGAIVEKTEVDGKRAEEWLRQNSLTDQFRQCEDGKELTPSITGPKQVAAFGSAQK